MRKAYYLKTCSTCQRILKEVDAENKGIELQNIKEEVITPNQLEKLKEMAGSYESLFSKRSMKYRVWGLHEKTLSENDMKDYILKEYTFLKRPVFVIDDAIFVGNRKKVVESLREKLNA